MYVVSLASSDALVGVLQWVVGSHYLPRATDWFDNTAFACVGMFSVTYIATIGSAFNIKLIALDRYFHITRPLLYERLVTERRVLVAIGCAWLAAFLIGGTPIVFNTFQTARVCTLEEVVPTVFRSYICASIFVVCCFLIFVVYAEIGWLSHRTLKTISQTRGNLAWPQTHNGTGPGEASAAQAPRLASNPRRPQRGSFKAVKLFVVVFGCLVVCWSPYFIVEMIGVFKKVDKGVYQYCLILGFLNSGVNALVYPLFSKDFRRALKRMLYCERCRCARQWGGRVTSVAPAHSVVLEMTLSSSPQRPSQSMRESKTRD